MPIEKDADYANYLYTCNRCRGCTTDKSGAMLPVCPSYSKFGFFAYSGGGKGYAAQGVLEGKVEPSPGLIEVAMNCLLCGACATMCPPGFEATAFIRDLRDHAVQEGFHINNRHKAILENLSSSGNPWGAAASERITADKVGAVSPEEAECLLFLGCHAGLGKASVESVIKVLNAAGVSFAVLPDEPCCGAPALDMGDRELFEEMADKTIAAIEESGVERVVTLCPHCASTMTNDYWEVGDLEAEVVPIIDLLAELIGEGRLELKEGDGRTVSFHDPCHLARYLEQCDSPREVLEAMPELELKEMTRSREATFCCGSGGWSCEVVPELSTWTAQERLKELDETGADTVVTACSYCQGWLGKLAGEKFKVTDLVDLVAERV